MRIARLVCSVGVALFLLESVPLRSLQGQSPTPAPQQPAFRSTTTLVQVDVIALDKQGNFVPDLTAENLTLSEDGKPQKIQQFFVVAHDHLAGAAAGGAAVPEERAQRVFVLLFDESHLANDSLQRIKKGAEQFIQDVIGPNDFGGVFVNGGMFRGRLTTSKAELLAGVQTVSPAFDNRQRLLAPFQEFPRIPGEIDASRIAEGARELVDRLGEQACREDAFQCQLNGGVLQVENLIQNKARLYVQQARVLTATTVQNLQYVIGRLARIPGRKTVVLLSEGFYVEDSRALLQTIAAQAARGGTVIYSIDGRGLINRATPDPDVNRPERTRSNSFDTGEDGPTILASGTGGLRVTNIDDISRAFGLVVRDTSSYYVLGYQPDNPTLDGKFRKIDVKTNLPGLNLRARKGYVASALPPLEVIRGRH
jgi:VWFA-related protein